MKPHSRRSFILADGSEIAREIGDAVFRLAGRRGASPVIFGERDESVLLDPLKRELRPLPMLLAPSRRAKAGP